MSKISRAGDSIWHTAGALDDPALQAEYEAAKARKDAHRADAAKLSDADLHNAHDDLADDIELDKHNEYPFFDHFFNPQNLGPEGTMPEHTPEQKAHDDLVTRREAFGDELDARGLWGPKREAERQKMVQRMNDWPKNFQYREGLIQRGILDLSESWNDEDGFNRYMNEGGFDLDRADKIAKGWQAEGKRRANRKITELFGYNGFDPSNPEHWAIRKSVLDQGGKVF